MRIELDDKTKLATLWLERGECENDAVEAFLMPCYSTLKTLGYRTAVYRSGNGDLLSSTRALLLGNVGRNRADADAR